jgi:hypothetical protein
MRTEQVHLVESSVDRLERDGHIFAENFVREMRQMKSIAPTSAPSRDQINPLTFLLSARDRFRQIEEAGDTLKAGAPPQDTENFNLAANATLRALTKTLGTELDPGVWEAWVSAFRVIAERGPLDADHARQRA